MKKSFLIILTLAFTTSVFSQTSLVALLQKTDAFCISGAASISIFGGTPPYQITWSNGDNGSSINGLAPGSYSVNIKDAATKDTTISFSIDQLVCEVGISNHFTPNDDGYNDTWGISNIQKFPNFEIIVFNRWGQTVHHQSQLYIPWDGRSLGVNLPDASYYYIFYYDKDSKDKILKGDVSILR